MDQNLANYGPETKEAREELRRDVTSAIEKVWPSNKNSVGGLKAAESSNKVASFQSRLQLLTPKNNAQQLLLSEAVRLGNEVSQNRWLLIEENQVPLPKPLLVLLVFWLTLLFASLGLFAPPNATVLTVLLICAMSMASAIFLVQELNRPLDGCIKVSDAPLRKALYFIGK